MKWVGLCKCMIGRIAVWRGGLYVYGWWLRWLDACVLLVFSWFVCVHVELCYVRLRLAPRLMLSILGVAQTCRVWSWSQPTESLFYCAEDGRWCGDGWHNRCEFGFAALWMLSQLRFMLQSKAGNYVPGPLSQPSWADFPFWLGHHKMTYLC